MHRTAGETGIERTGKAVGLVGMGNLSRRMGKPMKMVFNAKLMGYDPYCSKEQADSMGLKKFEDLNRML